MEEDKMTLCLQECLKAVGLEHYYARFTSVGVRSAAHLSGLTMEDYPILGIRSMEDRNRLFHLVQMVKTLELEYEDHEDDDYNTDGGDESYTVVTNSITYDACRDPDEDVYAEGDTGAAVSKLNAASFSKSSCGQRQLDICSEAIDRHQKLFTVPVGTGHVFASTNINNDKRKDKQSVIPVHLELESGNAVVCSCKGNNNHRLDDHSHQYDHQTGANAKPDIKERNSMHSYHAGLLPTYVSPHKPKPIVETVPSRRFSNKLVGYRDRKGFSTEENVSTDTSRDVAPEHMATTPLVYETKRTGGYNYGLPLSSPPVSNKKQPGGQRISVCVRKRPLTRTECRRGEADVVTTPSGECVTVHESKESVDLTQYILKHKFYFDQVFGEESSNKEVYQKTAYPLVQHMLNGGKATCFAFGQTGAGKTHTMLGSSPGRPGLYTLAVHDIFVHLSTSYTHSPLLVYVSFFEIYCGQLYDLLDHRKRLFAREDGQKVVHIAGLRDVRVDSVSSLLEVISQGTEERTQGMSGVNPISSRSHALLQIQLRCPNQQIAGRMWFVDLAGSEKASDMKEPDRQSRMEGADINRSLLALKECIRSLDQEQSHTPFRQSKLTQVLKDSFVGDSMTCMIANISPGLLATEHTLNTLRYADRVKELKGQGGLRGQRRRDKTIHPPKHNMSNSSRGSSVGTRGKSPPKKPKLGRQREPTSPSSKFSPGGGFLCSTPKNNKWGEEMSARARNMIGLEQMTPIRGFLEIDENREMSEMADERKVKRREMHGGTDSAGDPINDQNMAGLVLRRAGDELQSLEIQMESGIHHRAKEIQQRKRGSERENRWIGQTEQVENKTKSRDTCSDIERLRERDLQIVTARDKERESHLRRYHQHLQQFMPLSASSHHIFTSSHPSFSSCNQASLSSSVPPSSGSPLQHSSSSLVSALVDRDKNVLDASRDRGEVRADGNRGQLSYCAAEEINLQTATSPSSNKNKGVVSNGDSDCIHEDWRSLREKVAVFGQDKCKSEKRKSLMATGEGELRVSREDRGPSGMEQGERGWAWVGTAETEQTNRMTGARPADVETKVSYNCDSQMDKGGQDASDVRAHAAWSTEEQGDADDYHLESIHSNNHPPVESPHQRAPAERPLSPVCEHTNTLLTPVKLNDLSLELKHLGCSSNILPLLQNAQEGKPSSSYEEKGPWFATDANRKRYSNAQSSTLPLATLIAQNGCKIAAEPLKRSCENPAHSQVHNHPEAKAKISGLAQGEASTDSVSYIIDPLSISMLQAEPCVATASFLQGDHNKSSLCLLENERGEGKRSEDGKERLTCVEIAGKAEEDKDPEFRLSLLELPQAKTRCPPTSDTMTATNHSEGRKDGCFATYEHYGLETSAMQSVSSSVQHSENAGSHSSQNQSTNGATKMPPFYPHNVYNKHAFSILKQPESGLSKLSGRHCQKEHSNYSSNISLQPNSPTEWSSRESTNNLQTTPVIHLSTLEDLYHSQWHLIQAHWEQLEEMETLCHKEKTLLCQQPEMAFEEYVHKLGEIMEKKAQCIHSMLAQLQPYLKTSYSKQQHNHGVD